MSSALIDRHVEAFSVPLEELSERPLETSLCLDKADTRQKRYEDGFAAQQLDTDIWQVRHHAPDMGLLRDRLLVDFAIQHGSTDHKHHTTAPSYMVHPRIANQILQLGAEHADLGAPAITRQFVFDASTGVFSDFEMYLSRVKISRLTHDDFEVKLHQGDAESKELIELGALMMLAVGAHHDRRPDAKGVSEATARNYNVVANDRVSDHVAGKIPWVYRVEPDSNGMRFSTEPGYISSLGLYGYGTMGPSFRKLDSFLNSLNGHSLAAGEPPRIPAERLARIISLNEQRRELNRKQRNAAASAVVSLASDEPAA